MENNDVDETLIEATIRRVAEAQAARAAGETTAEPESDHQAARDSEWQAELPPNAVNAVEAPDVEPPDIAIAEASLEPVEPALEQHEIAAKAVDESAIEAAIRRVQAAKAEREQEASPDAQVEAESTAPSEPISFPIRGNALPKATPVPDPLTAALERIERTLTDIDQTVRLLAAQLNRHPAPLPHSLEQVPTADDGWEDDPPAVVSPGFSSPPRPAIFRDVVPVEADVPQHAAPQPQAPAAALQPDERRGFDLLPRTYRITVEDKRRAVDLVPLHRALLGMDGVRDMSLLSYNNGVALVSLETVNDIDTDVLSRAVSRAMSREARVETHNERTLVIKLAED